MKKGLINILKKLDVYHPLQTFYRNLISYITKVYYRISYLRFKGEGFSCNYCGARYSKFVPDHPGRDIAKAINDNNVIAGPGENVYCPNCLSKNRERLVKAVIERLLEVKNKKILHFSPERNLYNYLKNIAEIKTADISPGFYEGIDDQIVYADATDLHFSDNSFDIIIANHILEHIPEDVKAMKEMYRVLKDNGFAILQVPYSETLLNTIEDPYINDPAKQAELFGQKDHVRIYSLNDYIDRLKSAGFNVKVFHPGDLVHFRLHAIQERESVITGWKTN